MPAHCTNTVFHVKHKAMAKNTQQKDEKQQISVTLHGADLRTFRAFKLQQRLMHDSEAARKLMLERLAQIEKAA